MRNLSRFIDRVKPITETIKKNKLPMFREPLVKTTTKQAEKVASLKSDCALFSHLYIACQSRDGNLEEFFKHENQPWPPTLAHMGKLRQGQKSDLVTCMESLSKPSSNIPLVDVTILDGAVVVQMLSPGTAITFQEYADYVFLPYVTKQLDQVKRVDVVWDVYQDDSLKSTTREKRGTGTRRRVTPSSKLPKNWKSFLRVNENKTELFQFLAKELESTSVENKELYTTYGEYVLSSPRRDGLMQCSHEEADTRILLHALDASQCGYRKILIRTIDTDIVVLAVSEVKDMDIDEMWIAFGMGKHYRFLPVHDIAVQLEADKCRALPMFHAITGCDTVSFFSGKGKKSAWDVWNVFPEITNVFASLTVTPGGFSNDIASIERFVVLLYSRTSSQASVNKARQELFSRNARTLENIPPTQAALLQHTKHAVYQAGFVWGSPSAWGWEKVGHEWRPVWTLLAQAQDTCYELIHCGCKKGCKRQCKCTRANLVCTALCKCGGECSEDS